MSALSENIKRVRIELGYTVKDFAEMVETNPKAIRLIEKGERQPRADLLERISKALGYSVDRLMGLVKGYADPRQIAELKSEKQLALKELKAYQNEIKALENTCERVKSELSEKEYAADQLQEQNRIVYHLKKENEALRVKRKRKEFQFTRLELEEFMQSVLNWGEKDFPKNRSYGSLVSEFIEKEAKH